MTKELEKLTSLVLRKFNLNCIYLSGNTHSNIRKVKIDGNRVVIEIAPPDYDLDKYMATGVIEFLNDGKSYANETNQQGTIFRPDETRYWVNSNCVRVCKVFANEIGAIVKNKLPINPKW